QRQPGDLDDHFTRIYLRADASERKQAVVDRFTSSTRCPECHGTRLNAPARTATVNGLTIAEYAAMQISDLIPAIHQVADPAPVVEGLLNRLTTLTEIGLGYLSLDRPATTLSGGESQRIKMVRHLGSSLTEMVYVFDEPTTGLHPRDVARLTEMLTRLRDKGNTILVVEHDPDVIQAADHVVDLGPGAGIHGGQIVYQGNDPKRTLQPPAPLNTHPRPPTGHVTVHANRNNLRDVTVDFPTGVLTAVTGVAGSGKSSLVGSLPGATVIDQSAVSTNRRSTVATYTGIADHLRRLFARTHDVSPALFSANSAGACPDCRGLGVVDTDLAFMDGITTVCETCRGKRFTDDVLKYTVDGRSIADVLDMTVAEADIDHPSRERLLAVGLGYLTLGRSLPTLSGGECQRLKLATELGGGGLYVLDEPTTGLHPTDVQRLVGILDGLVDDGNTVVVVEHNLDVIRQADWLIDLGPGAGNEGGEVVFTGPPGKIANCHRSATGTYI
ncbi:ATP-binding cassette domain-containing protein, partial [Kibdelosporangium lantanae]